MVAEIADSRISVFAWADVLVSAVELIISSAARADGCRSPICGCPSAGTSNAHVWHPSWRLCINEPVFTEKCFRQSLQR